MYLWHLKSENLQFALFHVKQVVCHAFSKPFYQIPNKYSLIFVCNYCFQCQRQRNWVSKAFIRNCITKNNLIKLAKIFQKACVLWTTPNNLYLRIIINFSNKLWCIFLIKRLIYAPQNARFLFNSVLSSTKWLKIM